MKNVILLMNIALLVLTGNMRAETEGETLFADDFTSADLSADWAVEEGQWSVKDGALCNTGGGLIALNEVPGPRFILDAELKMPANWVSVIFFYTSPEAFGTLYLSSAQYEFFDIDGKWPTCGVAN